MRIFHKNGVMFHRDTLAYTRNIVGTARVFVFFILIQLIVMELFVNDAFEFYRKCL